MILKFCSELCSLLYLPLKILVTCIKWIIIISWWFEAFNQVFKTFDILTNSPKLNSKWSIFDLQLTLRFSEGPWNISTYLFSFPIKKRDKYIKSLKTTYAFWLYFKKKKSETCSKIYIWKHLLLLFILTKYWKELKCSIIRKC